MRMLRGTLSDPEAFQYVHNYVDISGDAPERRALERLWFVNKAYYAGAQYIVLDDGRLRIPRRRGKNREFFQANKILPKVVKATAKLLAMNPDFIVAPKSGEFEDLVASQTSLKVWSHLKQTTKFGKQLRRALNEASLCGTGWLKVTFDPEKGVADRIYTKKGGGATLEPMFNEELRRQFELEGQFVDDFPGEVRIDVPSTFSVYWDPNARAGGVDDCMWMAEVGYTPIEDLIDRYGDLGFAGDDYERGAALYEENIANLASGLQGYNGLGTFAKSQIGTRCRVIEFWERPAPRNNNEGRYILTAGNLVVRNGKNPYAASGSPIPYVKVDWFPFEGRFIQLSLVEQLRPSQKAYNRSRSHAIEYEKTYGYAPVFVPKSAAIKAVNLTSVPGQVFEFEGSMGVAPTFGNTPRLPDYVGQNAAIAAAEMDEISAQASPAKNALPAGIRSGAAIQMVQADNNAVLTPISHALLEAVAQVGTQALQLAGLYYNQSRVAQILGDGQDVETFSFVGADLRGHYEVQLRGEPTALESREAYKQTIMDSIQTGALRPAEDKTHASLIMKALRFHSAEEILDVETRQQQDEHRIIQKTLRDPTFEQQVLPFHDPEARLPVLEHFLNGPQFNKLDPFTQGRIFSRWQQFTAILAQRRQAEIQAQQAIAGTPGQKGEASQPKVGATR